MEENKFMRHIRKNIISIAFVSLIFSTYTLLAQDNAPERIPNYPVPYVYPTVDGIKGKLNQIRIYYESTSSIEIIDSETGQEILDYSKPNKNACVSPGFAPEWS
jgi:hypothetical protein